MQAVDLKPDWPKGYTRVGAAAFHLQDWKKATAAYEKGVGHVNSLSFPYQLSQGLHSRPESRRGGLHASIWLLLNPTCL